MDADKWKASSIKFLVRYKMPKKRLPYLLVLTSESFMHPPKSLLLTLAFQGNRATLFK